MAHRELSSHGWRDNSRQSRQGTENPEGVWEEGQGCPPRALRARTHARLVDGRRGPCWMSLQAAVSPDPRLIMKEETGQYVRVGFGGDRRWKVSVWTQGLFLLL